MYVCRYLYMYSTTKSFTLVSVRLSRRDFLSFFSRWGGLVGFGLDGWIAQHCLSTQTCYASVPETIIAKPLRISVAQYD